VGADRRPDVVSVNARPQDCAACTSCRTGSVLCSLALAPGDPAAQRRGRTGPLGSVAPERHSWGALALGPSGPVWLLLGLGLGPRRIPVTSNMPDARPRLLLLGRPVVWVWASGAVLYPRWRWSYKKGHVHPEFGFKMR
jgi:hypothetical protein